MLVRRTSFMADGKDESNNGKDKSNSRRSSEKEGSSFLRTSILRTSFLRQLEQMNGRASAASAVAPRSIDDFLQTAYDEGGGRHPPSGREGSASRRPLLLSNIATLRDGILSRSWYALIVFSVGLSSSGDASELFSIGYVIDDDDFRKYVLDDDLAGNGALVVGILTVGLIVGGLGTAAAEDRFGRKSIMLSGLALSSFCGMLSAATSDAPSFAACRLGAGVGIGAVLATSSALLTELAPPRERGLIGSVANGCWTIGTVLNAVWALVIFGTYGLSWRVYTVVTTLPSMISFVLILALVPDSPRYLALHGDYDGAAECANLTAQAMGYCGSPLEAWEVEAIFDCDDDGGCAMMTAAPRLNESATSHWALKRAWDNVSLVYSEHLRGPTITIQLLWMSACLGNSLSYWMNTLFRNLHLSDVYGSFILLNCAAIPGNVASALLVDRVGRNAFFTTSIFLSGASLLAVAAIVSRGEGGGGGGGTDEDDAAAAVVKDLSSRTVPIILCCCIYYAALAAVYTVIYVMAAELFPTSLRSTGVAVCGTLGRVASFASQFVSGALIGRPAALLAAGAAVLGFGGMVSLCCPPAEMSQRPVLDSHHIPLSMEEEEEDDDDDYEMLPLKYGEVSMPEYSSIII